LTPVLAKLAGPLEPADAARAARLLARLIDKETEAHWGSKLATDLATLAAWLHPAEASRICTPAARQLALALAKEPAAVVREVWAGGLSMLATRLESADGARLLAEALAGEGDAKDCLSAALLKVVVERLEPAEVTRLFADAALQHVQALDGGGNRSHHGKREAALAILVQRLDGHVAVTAAKTLSRRIVSEGNANESDYWYDSLGNDITPFGRAYARSDSLQRFLTHATRPQVRQRTVAVTAAAGTAFAGPLLSLPFLPAAGEPLPCRLTTQELVDLLKMPTCFGGVRRVILDQLGHRYHRRFDTHWDFVRYAQEQRLNLDFTTPPQRPDAELPPLFER
jgi:hypothetical protein